MSKRWHCVRVHSRKELCAARQIRHDNYPVFAPLDGQGQPLIRGYVFLQFDPDKPPDLHRRLWRLSGIKSFLMYAGSLNQPYMVPDGDMERLIREEQRGVFARTKTGTEGTWELLEKMGVEIGDDMRVEDGVFIGYLAKLVDAKPGDRIAVLIDYFNRKTPFVLDVAQVSPA